MAATDFLTAIKDPTVWLSQHLSLTVAGLKAQVRPLEYTITEAMNELFELDLLIYSDDQTLDGVHFLGKNVSFVVEERAALKYLDTASRHARTLHGVVREFTHESSSKDGLQLRLRIAPRISLLDLTKTSDVFLQKTLKDIFYELFVDREHLFPHDIELNFEGVDQRYDQLLMDDESVLDFFRRQCLRHGLYWYFRHAPLDSKTHRDTLVVDNRANGYMRSVDVPYVRPNGLDGEFHEALLSIKRKQTLLPESVELRDHNYRTPNAPVSAIAYVDRGDKTLYGQIDRSNEHFHTPEEAQALTKVRAQGIASKQVIHVGTTNIAGLYPGWVLKTTNHKLPKAPYGLVIVKLKTTGSLSKPVLNEFEATPADKIWRPEYVPERDWKWMSGSIIATIESSIEGSPYADLDAHGRYLVRFHFHRGAGKSGSNSMRLRLMTPSASREGGFHAPLLPGTEVRIFFTNSDIDRPYIGFAAFDYSHTNHVHGLEGWNSREVWRSAMLGNKIRFENFKGREGVKLATIYQKSSVSMGYLVDNQKQLRGEGVEIHTQGHATVHGSKGLFFSADALSSPNAPHLEMTPALEQLQSALSEAAALRQAAQRANATLAQVQAQQAALESAFKDLQQRVILLSAPDGIGAVTPKSIQLASGEHLAVAAGGSADLNAGDNFTAAAGKSVSLFAQGNGIKMLAANGSVDVQAQSGSMQMFSEQDMKITSADGHLSVTASKGITLSDGSGAYIKISGGNVEIGGPGMLIQRTASMSRPGASSLHEQFQSQKRLDDLHVKYQDADDKPIEGEVMNLLKGDGSPLKLTTAGDGSASQLQIAFDHFKAELPKLLDGNHE
jgi:type VI secretion system secreted protein VgrG